MIEEEIKKFVLDNFLFGDRKLDPGQLLFEEGIIDSFGFLTLLSFIENKFKVRFKRSEIAMKNFKSISQISKAIADKLKPPNPDK
jgi:D-alanine--poly(phosphoribitol) ligase subunit 2